MNCEHAKTIPFVEAPGVRQSWWVECTYKDDMELNYAVIIEGAGIRVMGVTEGGSVEHNVVIPFQLWYDCTDKCPEGNVWLTQERAIFKRDEYQKKNPHLKYSIIMRTKC